MKKPNLTQLPTNNPVIGSPQPATSQNTTAALNDKIQNAENLISQGSNAFLAAVDAADMAVSIFDADPTGMAKAVFCLVKVVLDKIKQVQGNKAQLAYIGGRIELVFPTLIRLREDTQACHQIKRPILSFKNCLEDCYAQAQKYAQKNWFKKIILAGADTENFNELVVRLNDNIAQLDLSLTVEQTVLLEAISKCQLEDKNYIMTNMQKILKLEEESMRELKAMRGEQQQFTMEQKEFNEVLGQQLEAIPLAMAEKLNLTAMEQQKFFQQQFTLLNKQFAQLHAPTSGKARIKPPISDHLSIPFYDLVIDRVLKKGSFATIYQGEWCGVAVVIKKVGSRLSGDNYKQFVNEFNNMVKLRHPNITQVYGACFEPEACIVMEYLNRGSLVELLEKKDMPLSQRAQIAADIANALRYLHDKGGMHRDLKPGHVLIDENFRAKLSDFGFAKSMNHHVSTADGLHQMGRRESTNSLHIEWLAPELLQRGFKASQKSDIYTLGLTLYYLFTGQSLFHSVAPELVSQAVKNGANRDKVSHAIPVMYRELILSCLSINPELRPDARDISTQLLSLLLSFSAGRSSTSAPVHTLGILSPISVFEDGNKYTQQGRHDQAYDCYVRAAQAGYSRAQTALGTALLQGIGCKQDKKLAYDWFLKAAKQLHLRGQVNVANMLEFGDGVPQDKAHALYWYEQAAGQGNQQAKDKVRDLKGAGVSVNLAKLGL